MSPMLALCPNCGAALRVSGGAPSARCAYCGVESLLGSARAAADSGPVLRIAALPPVKSELAGATVMFVALGLTSSFLASEAATSREHGAVFTATAIGAAVLAVVAGAMGVGELRRVREQTWLRANGIPGRARVRRVEATIGVEDVRLTLEVEVAGQPSRTLEHVTTIPSLLVSRMTDGAKLPVIVHPLDADRIEIQWQLL